MTDRERRDDTIIINLLRYNGDHMPVYETSPSSAPVLLSDTFRRKETSRVDRIVYIYDYGKKRRESTRRPAIVMMMMILFLTPPPVGCGRRRHN